MYSITIRLQSPEGHNELLADDLQTAEIVIENVISQALRELFEVVVMEDITINRFSTHDRSFPTQGSSGVRRPM